LSFREAGSRTLLSLLEAGELDLAILIQPMRHPALETFPLLEEELLLAVPRDHPLAGGTGRVRLAELRDEPFVLLREGAYDLRDQTLAACRRAGFEPQAALDGGEMDSMLRFVAEGIGVAILPAMVLSQSDRERRHVAVRRLQPRLTRALVLARRRDRYFSAAAREFTTILTETATATNHHDDASHPEPERQTRDL
jgi:DNA-binding transcriptional LysR family regulator